MAQLNDKKFIHSVYFWLRRDLSEDQLDLFKSKLQALTEIENIKQGFIGVPAPTDRPIIDRTYDFSLLLVFENKNEHDQYQDHPVHEDFRQSCGDFWLRVGIYDVV